MFGLCITLFNRSKHWNYHKIIMSQEPTKDKSTKVRLAAILSLQSRLESLSLLVKDSNVEIRKTLAENPSIPVKILELLAKDEESNVRVAVAENPSTPVKVMELLKTENVQVRVNLAINPSAPFSLRKRLTGEKDPQIRLMALSAILSPPGFMVQG